MKIAIHTISDDTNFGNRLQNYALKKELEADNLNEVLTLQDAENSNYNYYSFKKDISVSSVYLYLTSLKAILKSVQLFEIKKYFLHKRRENTFRKFTKLYVPKTKKINVEEQDFDLFVIGSDQIWNPNFRSNLKNDFLPGIKNKTVISYAASIGIENISDRSLSTISKGVKQLSAISVREFSAKKILDPLTDLDIQVHIDPTMLLSQSEWHEVAKNADTRVKTKDAYVLTYFLGALTDREKKYINTYAKQKKAKVININDLSEKYFSKIGPIEFLWLFEHAETVFADSYHAAVFSIIFKKNFEIFNRHDSFNEMNTRMETLFSHFNIGDRFHNLSLEEKFLDPVEYSEIDQILQKKRDEAKKWLENFIVE